MDLTNTIEMSGSNKKIQAYVGKVGSGKTLQIIIDALKNYERNDKVVYLTSELSINFINKRVIRICNNLVIDIPKINEFIIDRFDLNTLRSYVEDSKYRHIYIDMMHLHSLNEFDIIDILNLTLDKEINIYCGFNINEPITSDNIANKKYSFLETYAIVQRDGNVINTKYPTLSGFGITNIKNVLEQSNTDNFLLNIEKNLKDMGFDYLRQCPFSGRACYRKDNLSFYFDNHHIEYNGSEFSHISKKVTSLEMLINFIKLFKNE